MVGARAETLWVVGEGVAVVKMEMARGGQGAALKLRRIMRATW